MRQVGHVVFGGVFRSSGNLRASIDARRWFAEVAGCGHGAVSRLLDPLIRLRLRGPTRRLGQRPQDRAARQLDLEVVVAEAARISQYGFGRRQEGLARGRRSIELGFGLTVAP